jgi:hypothetical protein
MIDNLHLLSIEAEAREYCDRHEIRDYDSFQRIAASLRHRAFLRAIEPLNAMKARWLNLCLIPPKMLIHADGRVEHLPIELPPEMKKAFAELDELIILEAQRWGFDSSPLRTSDE